MWNSETYAVYETRFSNFVNDTFKAGYCKAWKSRSMISNTVGSRIYREIYRKDFQRLNNYVENCLEMEGFRKEDCRQIAVYLNQMIEETDQHFA